MGDLSAHVSGLWKPILENKHVRKSRASMGRSNAISKTSNTREKIYDVQYKKTE